MPRSPGGGCGGQPGGIAVLRGAGPPRAGRRSLAAGTGALIWVPSPGDPWDPVSPPSRRARGNVTAWLLFRRRDLRHGRAPWPGPHRGPAGRAAGRHAWGARAGPCAGAYGSAALFLISPVSHPSRWPMAAARPCWPGFSGTIRIAARVGRHPKVPAGWNIAARQSLTRRCYRAGWAVSGDQGARSRAQAPALVR